MRIVAAWVLTLFLVVHAAGQPVAKITGPTENTPGNLCILKTEGTVGSGLVWLVLPESASANFLDATDRSGAVVGIFSSSKPGTYQFILACTQEGQVAMAVHTLKQGEPEPQPDNTPNNPPSNPANTIVAIVYESGEAPLPPYAMGALKTLVSQGYECRAIDDDITTGLGEQPKETRPAIEAARERGLPSLVVLVNGKVKKAVAVPTSASAIVDEVN